MRTKAQMGGAGAFEATCWRSMGDILWSMGLWAWMLMTASSDTKIGSIRRFMLQSKQKNLILPN
jgi:hypothetical protein